MFLSLWTLIVGEFEVDFEVSGPQCNNLTIKIMIIVIIIYVMVIILDVVTKCEQILVDMGNK